jgi:argininosuccinate synthase
LKNKKTKKLSIEFVDGEINGINGRKINKIKAIEMISEICESYCIGRNMHVGDTIVGIKGRVGFEAGGPQLIIKAHHLLEKHTLTKWQLFQKDRISDFYGMLLHEGQYLDPVMRDIESFLTSSQSKVSGSVIITLFPYRFELDGIISKNDLMNSKFGLYGEKNNLWDSDDAKGFIKILSNQNKIYQNINEKKKN